MKLPLVINMVFVKQVRCLRINATQIKQVCGEWGLSDKLNRLIAELKGA